MYFDINACGQRIKQLRNARGLTQSQVSTQLGVGERHLRKLEQGDTCGSLDLLIDISDYFDVTLDYLLLGRQPLTSEELKGQLHKIIVSLQMMERTL